MKTFEEEYQEHNYSTGWKQSPDQVWSKYEDFIERFNYLLEG